MRMSMVLGIPRKHAHSLQRLQSLAFGFGHFMGLTSPPPRTKSVEPPPLAHFVGWLRKSCIYSKDQASLLHDGLLEQNPTPYSDDELVD
jgi:hypothetical protein